MNSNFHLNSIRNFNSDFFHLVPSKFVTFGEGSGNNISSEISDNLSYKNENNNIFMPNQSNQSNKFEFDFAKSPINNKGNNVNSRDNSSIKQIKSKGIQDKKSDPIYSKYSFKIGSKTTLNMLNTCLLDLFIPLKKDVKNNVINTKHNYNNTTKIIQLLKEESISNNKDNKDDNQIKSNSFLKKIKFSPIKNIPINNYGNEINDLSNIKCDTVIEINNQNDIKIKNLNNTYNNIPNQGAFKAIKNNYENPAKIPSQYEPPQIKAAQENFIPRPIPIINKISNISNVTNNIIFQYNNQPNLLKKKTKRTKTTNNNSYNSSSVKKNKDNNINFKTSKNEEVLYGLYQLNQISVNGVSISKFPVVSMNEDDLEVYIVSKMLNETDYFTIVGKYYINIPVLDEEKYNKPSYDNIFKKEKEKISNLYLIGDNLKENNPVKLIRNFYLQIKEKILNIQNNYLCNNKKALSSNIELVAELEKLIISCNAITNTVTDYKKSGLKRKLFLEQSDEDEKSEADDFNKEGKAEDNNNKNILKNEINEDNLESNNNINKKKKQKKKHFKTYLCEFCNKAYSNGQGLGGHMSRIHPNQSSKYKDKIRIRREREKKREKLLYIKRDLFKKYGYDYDILINSKKKIFVQQFLHEHNEEYRNIRKNIQKESKSSGNENFSENEDDVGKKNMNVFSTPLPVKFVNVFKKKVECKEIINNNLSKQKTNEKTDFKNNISKNDENIKDNEIGIVKTFNIKF